MLSYQTSPLSSVSLYLFVFLSLFLASFYVPRDLWPLAFKSSSRDTFPPFFGTENEPGSREADEENADLHSVRFFVSLVCFKYTELGTVHNFCTCVNL